MSKLKPGETCLFCNHTEPAPEPKAAKVPRVKTDRRPKCALCQQPFTRERKWRLFRGKRIHRICPNTANHIPVTSPL